MSDASLASGEGTGGAPVGAPSSGGAPAQGGGLASELAPAVKVETPWYEGASDESRSWIESQKIASLDQIATSHRNLVKLKGVPDSELLRLPAKWEENPETAAQVYARMGRPEKAEQYEIPSIPVGNGDVDLAPQFKQWAHAAGLSGRQATTLATQYQGVLVRAAEARKEAIAADIATQNQALRSEWGGEYDANVQAAQRALAVLGNTIGLTMEDLVTMEQSPIGHAKAAKLLALIGRTIGEHETVKSDVASRDIFGMTPEVARQKAREMSAERMTMKPGDPRRETVSREITRLHSISTGEEIPSWMRD